VQIGAEGGDGQGAVAEPVEGYGEVGCEAEAALKARDMPLRPEAQLNG